MRRWLRREGCPRCSQRPQNGCGGGPARLRLVERPPASYEVVPAHKSPRRRRRSPQSRRIERRPSVRRERSELLRLRPPPLRKTMRKRQQERGSFERRTVPPHHVDDGLTWGVELTATDRGGVHSFAQFDRMRTSI